MYFIILILLAFSSLRVVDGDTIHYKGQCIRLLRINTPERGEPGFGEAKAHLESLLRGKLRLEYEGRRKDRYGRELCYIWCRGKNVNVEMVRAGWSPFWTKYGEGKYAKEFREAEAEAKREGRGIWKNAHVLPSRVTGNVGTFQSGKTSKASNNDSTESRLCQVFF